MDTVCLNDFSVADAQRGAEPAADAHHSRIPPAHSSGIDPEVCTRRLMPVVRRMARNLKRLLPSSVELDDLIQSGMLGLLRALSRYRGPAGEFQYFAVPRIRSAMIEGLSALDSAPLELRRTVRRIRHCVCDLEQKLRRVPSSREIAAALGLSLEEYQRIICEQETHHCVTMRKSRKVNGDDTDPVSVLQHYYTVDALVTAISVLPRREQLMLQYRYEEAMKLDAIGAMFGVSESRVSQVLKHVMTRLRTRVPR